MKIIYNYVDYGDSDANYYSKRQAESAATGGILLLLSFVSVPYSAVAAYNMFVNEEYNKFLLSLVYIAIFILVLCSNNLSKQLTTIRCEKILLFHNATTQFSNEEKSSIDEHFSMKRKSAIKRAVLQCIVLYIAIVLIVIVVGALSGGIHLIAIVEDTRGKGTLLIVISLVIIALLTLFMLFAYRKLKGQKNEF